MTGPGGPNDQKVAARRWLPPLNKKGQPPFAPRPRCGPRDNAPSRSEGRSSIGVSSACGRQRLGTRPRVTANARSAEAAGRGGVSFVRQVEVAGFSSSGDREADPTGGHGAAAEDETSGRRCTARGHVRDGGEYERAESCKRRRHPEAGRAAPQTPPGRACRLSPSEPATPRHSSHPCGRHLCCEASGSSLRPARSGRCSLRTPRRPPPTRMLARRRFARLCGRFLVLRRLPRQLADPPYARQVAGDTAKHMRNLQRRYIPGAISVKRE